MVRFTAADDLSGAVFDAVAAPGARFHLTDLSRARFDQSYLTGAVMRGVDLSGADIDGDVRGLVVNGVAVAPLVEAELDRRYPGRALRRSAVPAEQLEAFDAAQRAWSMVTARATARPELRDARVAGEWSVSQTLRHLVFATDGWLRYGVLGLRDAFAPIGVPFTEWQERVAQLGVDVAAAPAWDEVLAVRADRARQVRQFLADVTPGEFAAPARGLPPWYDDVAPQERGRSVAQCLGVVGNEEWEHLRFAVRDLDAVEAGLAP